MLHPIPSTLRAAAPMGMCMGMPAFSRVMGVDMITTITTAAT